MSLFEQTDLRPHIEEMNRIIRELCEYMTADFHIRPDGTFRRVDRHHPRPLPIDGAEYHRRRRNR